MIDLSHIIDTLNERERIVAEGTLGEVIELAKEYHINIVQEHTTTPYKVMVDRIKQRLTNEKYDWTTI
jgi:hypothetical protein